MVEGQRVVDINRELPRKYRPPVGEGGILGRVLDRVPRLGKARAKKRAINEIVKAMVRKQGGNLLKGREQYLAIQEPSTLPDVPLGLKEATPAARSVAASEDIQRADAELQRAQENARKTRERAVKEAKIMLAAEVPVISDNLHLEREDLGFQRVVLELQRAVVERKLLGNQEDSSIVIGRKPNGEYVLTVMQGQHGVIERTKDGTMVVHPNKGDKAYNMTLEQYAWSPATHLSREVDSGRTSNGAKVANKEMADNGVSRLSVRDDNGNLNPAVFVEPIPLEDGYMRDQQLSAAFQMGNANRILVVGGRNLNRGRGAEGKVDSIGFGLVRTNESLEISRGVVADVTNGQDSRGIISHHGNENLRNAYLDGRGFKVDVQ
ncbi:MAG TPA: hypothetical protein VF189_04540 [Patescibacteria group bacterium]